MFFLGQLATDTSVRMYTARKWAPKGVMLNVPSTIKVCSQGNDRLTTKYFFTILMCPPPQTRQRLISHLVAQDYLLLAEAAEILIFLLKYR